MVKPEEPVQVVCFPPQYESPRFAASAGRRQAQPALHAAVLIPATRCGT
jgi:hypothetical protein